MPRPGTDLRDTEENTIQVRITVAKSVSRHILRMRRKGSYDNDSQALRVCIKQGLEMIEAKDAPNPATVKRSLPVGSRYKDLKLLESDVRRLDLYHHENFEHVDGRAGAARHAIWIATNSRTVDEPKE